MVNHTFLFTGAVRRLKELLDSQSLGRLYYYDSVRINLGLFQHDVNVIWDLAPHDLSIMDYLLDKKPVSISAHGACHFNNSLHDVAYLILNFDKGLIDHFHLNWLSPTKIRHTIIGGEKRQELCYFRDCLETGQKPHNDGEAGLRIVKLLEASNRSLSQGGQVIEI